MTQITAHPTPKKRQRGGKGLETLVDMAALGFLVLGSLLALAMLMSFSLRGLLAAAITLAGAFMNWLLLRCLAEHLRLQKKIAGFEFEGKISGPNEETIWCCSHCGNMLHSDQRCDVCGAQILPKVDEHRPNDEIQP